MYNILNFTLEELQDWMKENKESALEQNKFFLGYTRMFGILMI